VRGFLEEEELFRKKLRDAGVREEDISESFIRSRGPGGQNVNKVSTCVFLRHIPTGIEVKCQQERSQAQNRYLARRLLLEKIIGSRNSERLKERQLKEKLRRQTRRRPKGLKEKILREKRRHSEKKSLRSKVRQLEE
jgi:protein subunit release factor B